MPTAKQAHRDISTHIVAQDGSGEYATIGAALGVAGEGYTILVRPGTYEESLILDRSVTIIGDSRRGPVVIAPSSGPAFTIMAGTATLADLVLRGPNGTVAIQGGTPTLRGLHFESLAQLPDAPPGPSTDVPPGPSTDVPPGTPIGIPAGPPAISVLPGASATLVGNTIAGRAVGVSVTGSAPTLEGNTMAGNVIGLQVAEAGTPVLRANSICGNVTDVEVLPGGLAPDRSADAACP